MKRQCPKCKALDPPIDYNGGGWHNTTSCANIIKTNSYFFGLVKIPKKCGYVASMGDEDEDNWNYITTKTETKTEDMRFNENSKNFYLNDINDNVINLFNFHSYVRKKNILELIPHKGQNIKIFYKTENDAKEVLEEILKREKLYAD